MKAKPLSISTVITFGITIFISGYILVGGGMNDANAVDTWHYDLPDFDYNGEVNIDDLTELAINWLQTGYISDHDGPGVDTNGDGIVNMIDFAELSRKWNKQANDTRIAVKVTQQDDPINKKKISYLEVHNDSPTGPDYRINWLYLGTGTDNIDDVQMYDDFEKWLFEDIAALSIILDASSPSDFIDSGTSNSTIQVDANYSVDPNEVIFEDAEVKARTRLEEESLPVEVPLPKRK